MNSDQEVRSLPPQALLAAAMAARAIGGREQAPQALEWLRKPTRFVDRALRPRLTLFTRPIYIIAIVCAVIAAAMPAMELVPFSATGAGAPLTAFGLSLIAEDGLLALLAFIFTAVTFGLVIYNLL